MREIKFRGKAWFGGEWHYGLLATGTGDYSYIKSGHVGVRVDPETVGQFTGLFDKNDNEIYEGDILNFYDVADNGVVVMKDGAYMAVNEDKLQIVLMLGFHEPKVIGNIHDNPDLLKP